ncbi:hypothetical protein [Nocardiopsis flavescens]|uniref:hypothetical protein n=1 Tax=Nocardiopsis flavescens TaxID=758803 RepID=UPI00373FD4AA
MLSGPGPGRERTRAVPVRGAERPAVPDRAARAFEPGVRYTEADAVIGGFGADVTALRRGPVDEGFPEHDRVRHRRCGGTVDP